MTSDLRRLFALAALLLAAVLITGCATTAPSENLEPLRNLRRDSVAPPVLAIDYYAYGPAEDWQVAAPHPLYDQWTDRRMQKDIQRLRDLGIEHLLLHLDPKAVSELQGKRVERFAELVGEMAPDMSLVLHVDAAGCDLADLQRFGDWVAARNLYNFPAYEAAGGRPVVELQNATALPAAPRLELIFRPLKPMLTPPAFADVPSLRIARQSPTGSRLRIFAGRAVGADQGLLWTLPRQQGQSAADAFRAALYLDPDMLILHSWNHFRDGSFIQPNSLDGDAVYHRLRQSIATWRQQQAQP